MLLGRDGLINIDVLSDHGLEDLFLKQDDLVHVGRDIDADVALEAKADAEFGSGNICEKSVLSHFQPLCGKAFRQETKQQMKHCQTVDVNHCLAQCHAEAALLTVHADIQVGDLAHVNVCAAIEFDENDGENCHYWVRPEHQLCDDGDLKDGEGCTVFLRN